MVLNKKKTKCIPFINSKTKDFVPQISLGDGNYLEVIYQLKLVGLVITSELSWEEHVQYTVSRVNKIIWQLSRFKKLGASRDKLITFYVLKIRSILMFAAVCFHSSLNNELSHKLELQQKRCLAVILGPQYRSYANALSVTSLSRLDTLRSEACLKWALAAQQNPLHTDLFKLNKSEINTRERKKYQEYFCRTVKYFTSPVPYMTRLLNAYEQEK